MENEWRFYGRSEEIRELRRIVHSGRWFFCAISGRRRIGKTSLIQEALSSLGVSKLFYFQVPDSDERGVVQVFRDAAQDYGVPLERLEQVRTFADMANTISVICRNGWIVTIDEFQYFHRQTLSPFTSFLQAKVDELRDTKSGGLFVLGSIHTEMMEVLEDRSAPLFNRVTERIWVDHWDFETLFEVFHENSVFAPDQQLFLWTLFEGVPKFYRDCHGQEVLRPLQNHRTDTIRRLFFEGSSPLREEAANWFLRELRGRYDSVLKILAKIGPCAYGQLRDEFGRAGSGGEKQLGGYLVNLVEKFQMVEKEHPIFASKAGRKARYVISDNFLNAWLKAIERNVQMARVQPIEAPVARTSEALKELEGTTFERMIRLLLMETSRKGVGDFPLTEVVKGYWNRADGTDIEIDIVALNENDKVVRFGSCKRSARRHDGQSLKDFDEQIGKFLRTKEGRRLRDWRQERALFSPSFEADHRKHLGERGYNCLDLQDFAAFMGRPVLPNLTDGGAEIQ